MENRYFDFLCAIVGQSQEYSLLLEELHKIEYYALIPNDDNRGVDGQHLRDLFLEEVGPTSPFSFPQVECTMLEMLIALGYRLEFESVQSRWEKTPGEWFWVLVDNLGLSICSNNVYSGARNIKKTVKEISETLLARQYASDGNGGLFPLKDPKKDQRRVEIWYQMSAWIMENYGY